MKDKSYFQLSEYVFITRYKDDDYILYNPINTCIIKLDKSYFFEDGNINLNKFSDDELDFLIQNDFFLTKEEIFEILKKESKKNSEELFIIINFTEYCNLKCLYCYQNNFQSNNFIDNETIVKISEYVKKCIEMYNFKRVNFNFFGGEALLQKEKVIFAYRILNNICKANKVETTFSIDTNGTLIDNKFLKEFEQLDIDIPLTLKNDHDKYRIFRENGKGSFDIIWNNILECKDILNSDKINFGIRYNVNYDNFKELDRFLTLLDNHNIKSRITVAYTDEYAYNSFKNEFNKDKYKHWFPTHAMDILIKHKIKLDFFPFYGLRKFNCVAHSKFSCKFFSDGSIGACHAWEYDNRINVKLDDIINNPNLVNKYFKTLKNRNILDDPQCKKCKDMLICGGKSYCKFGKCKGLDLDYNLGLFLEKYVEYVEKGLEDFIIV